MNYKGLLKDIVPGDLGEPTGTFVAFPLNIVEILTSLNYDLNDIPDIFKATLNNGKTYYFAPFDASNPFFSSEIYFDLINYGCVGLLNYIDSRSEVKDVTVN